MTGNSNMATVRGCHGNIFPQAEQKSASFCTLKSLRVRFVPVCSPYSPRPLGGGPAVGGTPVGGPPVGGPPGGGPPVGWGPHVSSSPSSAPLEQTKQNRPNATCSVIEGDTVPLCDQHCGPTERSGHCDVIEVRWTLLSRTTRLFRS